MDVDNILFSCIIGFIIGLLIIILSEVIGINQEVKNGNCVYINNEYYCKD